MTKPKTSKPDFYQELGEKYFSFRNKKLEAEKQ
jgi:hypothetical protein